MVLKQLDERNEDQLRPPLPKQDLDNVFPSIHIEKSNVQPKGLGRDPFVYLKAVLDKGNLLNKRSVILPVFLLVNQFFICGARLHTLKFSVNVVIKLDFILTHASLGKPRPLLLEAGVDMAHSNFVEHNWEAQDWRWVVWGLAILGAWAITLHCTFSKTSGKLPYHLPYWVLWSEWQLVVIMDDGLTQLLWSDLEFI